jgi:hypothetical protein
MAVQRAAPAFETWVPNAAAGTLYVYQAGSTTLAPLWLDIGLTIPAANPQTLQSLIVNNIGYGKLAQAVYTNVPVQWSLSGAVSGVIAPPLSTLDGATADNALALAGGGLNARSLARHFGDIVWMEDFGDLSTSAATNTATLNQAIGVAAARNGGTIMLPPGNILISALTLPDGVLLRGRGRGVTTIMSQVNGNVITLGGDRAGLAELTLDGINLTPGSVGVFGANRNESRLLDVEIKRFETCLWMRGGRRADWHELYITNAVNGAQLWGDSALGTGSEFQDNLWEGGRVIQCTGFGIYLKVVDKLCQRNTFIDVGFESNTGPALQVQGARFTRLQSCWSLGNTTPLVVMDDSNAAFVAINTIQGFKWIGGGIGPASGSTSGGAVTLRDSLVGVELQNLTLQGVAFTLTVPANNVLVTDCIEDSAVTIGGVGTAYTRVTAASRGASTGQTTNNTATQAWSTGPLNPGEVVFLEAKVLARQLNGTNFNELWIATSAKRPGSTLAYYNKTVAFTVGQVVTGATSGAKGLITADAGGTNGPLTLSTISGAFTTNEVISDPLGGAALVQSPLAASNAVLLGAVTAVRAARQDDMSTAATFAVSGGAIVVNVTGDTAQTYNWTVHVEMVRN